MSSPHIDVSEAFTVNRRLERLERIINGDQTEDNPGLRSRVKTMETILARYERMELMVRGALVLSGIAGLSGAVSLVELIAKIFKVIP